MSTDTERIEEGTETSFLETWREWYHIPIVGAVVLFMFLVRILPYENFVTEDGSPAFAAIDSWYHWRTVEWTSQNYPWTMPYEIWTGFPTGDYVGQFGTLFDQLIVTAAMIVGLGDPSTETLFTVSLLAVPVMAALVAIPVFYIGRRLGGTMGGIASVFVLALLPGQFLHRTTTGQLQHHVAEVLFMSIAVLAMMVAVRAGEREQPIYELLVDRDWDALRSPTIYSALAGLALALYIWVWPPAVLLVGIFGVFFIVALCIDYLRGVSPDHLAFVGAVSFGVTAVITLLLIEDPGFSVTSFSYIQPALAILGVGGFVTMAWLARQWDTRGIERRYYPVAVLGLIVLALGALAVVMPDLFDRLVSEATGRIMPLDPADHRATIQEAQQPTDFLTTYVFSEYGAAFYTMVVGLILLAARPYVGREYRTEYTLVIVWSLFLTSMAATQIRFSYYLVLAIAAVNAVFVADVARFVNLDLGDSLASLRRIQGYQIIVVFMIVLLLFAPLLPPIAATATGGPVWEQSELGPNSNPSSDSIVWQESNEWLADNSPEPGDWGGADNASELEYFGSYDYPEGEDYDYPDGAYGVLSWWDYGHLITTQAERIPHSNPFQQHAESSSAYLTAESEERAELILEAISTGAEPDEETNEELRDIVDAAENTDEEIRYVMIDDAMAGDKFPAITQWTGPDYQYYTTPDTLEETVTRDNVGDIYGDLPYDNTTVAQLYFDDADGMEHYRLVHENGINRSMYASYADVFDEDYYEQAAQQDPQMEQLLQAYQAAGYEDGDVTHVTDDGQIAPPGQGQPIVVVNRQFNMFDRSEQAEYQQLTQSPTYEVFDVRQEPAVKTYERVEGATLTGAVDGAEEGTVTAALGLQTNGGSNTSYSQQVSLEADGSFELTVPYATNDELDVEDGYTDSAVEALGAYTVVVTTDDGTVYEGEVSVPESDVVEGGEIDVDLEPVDTSDGESGDDADDGTDSEDESSDADGGDETAADDETDSGDA
ncbi:oligosaccharyl transferase, archaeosortase A system-associated [Halopiger goleimassiliensis]|uniref:oligosaccharyl transferase, archaeosortase A system-associated n=1 Tax=Halopiger goleimassiliensis TaxID=1293048 RepID=UPI00067797CC|nr:oligosaccharyl transferase, archaeosortase A system-associated [Halopiger goleimassiliensis]